MNPTKDRPARGELWWIDWDPTAGREQQGRRPGLILSADRFNRSPAGLVVALPVTTRQRPYPFRVEVPAAEDGPSKICYAICEGLRSLSLTRLQGRIGRVPPEVMTQIEERIRLLLGL